MILRMTFHRLLWQASILLLLCTLALPARAVSLLRDADMEYALAQVADPILRAAGLSASGTKILVVDDASLNAFVIGNDAIYIHSGLIARMDRAAMLQAVIAHEAAHIANGHITRRLGIGAHAQRPDLVGPRHQQSKVTRKIRLLHINLTEQHLALGAVHRDDLAFFDLTPADAEHTRLSINL